MLNCRLFFEGLYWTENLSISNCSIYLIYFFPILFQQYEIIVYNAFEMAIHIFNVLKYYYLVALIFIIMFVCLTIWNNRTFKQHLQKEATYNVIQTERRKQIMEKLYHERFGPKKQRELVRYYSVSEEKNFLDDDIPKEVEPFIAIMIPVHNEELIIEDTIHYMLNKLHYSKYEVLVMDGGSTNGTPEILA